MKEILIRTLKVAAYVILMYGIYIMIELLYVDYLLVLGQPSSDYYVIHDTLEKQQNTFAYQYDILSSLKRLMILILSGVLCMFLIKEISFSKTPTSSY